MKTTRGQAPWNIGHVLRPMKGRGEGDGDKIILRLPAIHPVAGKGTSGADSSHKLFTVLGPGVVVSQ